MENKQQTLEQLTSSDMEIVKNAIEQIKQEGDISIASELLDILSRSRNATVNTNLISLLSDIKNPDFKTILIHKLINTTESSGKAHLSRICWESAIDFSEYFDLFVDILLNEDFIAALEASTVIENLSGKIPEEKIHHAIKRLKEHREEDKTFLLEDTILHLNELLLRQEENEDDRDG